MKKRIIFLLLSLTALLLTGCAMQTVEEMYAVPKRSAEYSSLQSAIDAAMEGRTYAAPVSGDNQQSVQMADLDGDGIEEYLVFAMGNSDKRLQVLIFRQEEDGACSLWEVIESSGAAFEQVEYIDFDQVPGCELVIGSQVSDQVLRSVSVFSFSKGTAQQLLMVGYTKFLTCDLDGNDRKELLVLRPGESEATRGMAVLYSSQGGQIQRSVEMELSEEVSHIRRITASQLQDGTPAVFVASSVDEEAIVTDIFALKDGKFTNISFSTEANTSIQTLRNFYVYAEDIDEDGVLELPSLLTMKAVSHWEDEEEKFLLRWFAMDVDGREVDKLFTFHYYVGGWYVQLDKEWASRVSVEQGSGIYIFYMWNETYQDATPLFTIYVLTGGTRDEDAVKDGRFAVYRTEGVAYAGKLEPAAAEYGITEEYIINSFRLIRKDWRTGEN